ncbi:2659_t:CDS:2, partial [Cetraspora pellucida]
MSLCKCYYNYKLFENCCAIKIHENEDKKINESNFQEYLYIALYGTVKIYINEQEFKNIFNNKPVLDNSNKQIPENLPNESNESNNNEQLSEEQNEQQLPDEHKEEQLPDEQEEEQLPDKQEEEQLPDKQEEQQIPDNTFLIENLKKAIKESKLNDLFVNEYIYKNIVNSLLTYEEKIELQDERKQELNNRINEMINETENIDNLKDNQDIDNIIKRSDITFYGKNLLQQNRKVKLNKLQQDLLEDYKEMINRTEVLLQLRELQLAIGNDERLIAEQKVILFDLINKKLQRNTQQEKINNIQEKITKTNEIVKLQVDIKEEIDSDKDLSTQQKRELHNLRNEKIRNLRGNIEMIRLQQEIENESFVEIQQTKDIERLKDEGYYVNRITEVREEYLVDVRSCELLDKARRSRLDFLYSENENQTYNLLLDLIQNAENINDISYNAINTLEQEYLTNERKKSILQEILNKRIEELYVEVPKKVDKDNNYPTTNPDKAEPNRNLAGTVDKQIQDIINQYKKTLNADDKRKFFPNIKNKPIAEIIKQIYESTKDKRSLLDVLYYKWVLGKDDSFLFEKNYKLTKINKTKKLIEKLNDYLYEEPRKKSMISRERLKKRKDFRKLKKHPMIFVPSSISWQNPLEFPEEKIDVIASIKIIIDEYEKSLANIFDITQKNIDIIQQSLSDVMQSYNTEKEKIIFLDVVTEVLINADLEVSYIKQEEIKNM